MGVIQGPFPFFRPLSSSAVVPAGPTTYGKGIGVAIDRGMGRPAIMQITYSYADVKNFFNPGTGIFYARIAVLEGVPTGFDPDTFTQTTDLTGLGRILADHDLNGPGPGQFSFSPYAKDDAIAASVDRGQITVLISPGVAFPTATYALGSVWFQAKVSGGSADFNAVAASLAGGGGADAASGFSRMNQNSGGIGGGSIGGNRGGKPRL